jgi:uncharacterized protein
VSGDRRTFEGLEGHRYMRLTTFPKSGQPVSSPVWFALGGNRIRVFTDVESGKVKHIRNNPQVSVAPSDFRGTSKGVSVQATARIMDDSEFDAADLELQEKYGWQYRLFQGLLWLLGKSSRNTFLELRPAAD